MAGSFFAFLDDIAVLARAAAASMDDIAAAAGKATVKSAGVVIDDAAVTPQYVQGIRPARELPVIWRIAKGSLVNKAIIVVAAMLLSIWAPWVFPWLLLVGGSYLAYEGAHKVWHWVQSRRGQTHETTAAEVAGRTEADEKGIVASAVRTDFVLSTEIMLISLSSIASDSWQIRLATLVVVALLMTVMVYGAVALLVKMDDVGLWLGSKRTAAARSFGRGLVHAMPVVFTALSAVGAAAMLWVGGHILFVNLAEVGVTAPYALLHTLTDPLQDFPFIAWCVDTLCSALLGLLWGLVLVGAASLFARARRGAAPTHPANLSATEASADASTDAR